MFTKTASSKLSYIYIHSKRSVSRWSVLEKLFNSRPVGANLEAPKNVVEFVKTHDYQLIVIWSFSGVIWCITVDKPRWFL